MVGGGGGSRSGRRYPPALVAGRSGVCDGYGWPPSSFFFLLCGRAKEKKKMARARSGQGKRRREEETIEQLCNVPGREGGRDERDVDAGGMEA